MSSNRVDELVTFLMKARDAYYAGVPIISDFGFEQHEAELKLLDPDNSYFNIVGSKEDIGTTKVKHYFPMLSIDNIKYPKPIYPWYNRIGISDDEELISEPKGDGDGISLVYENHYFKYAASRGRGDKMLGNIIPFGERFDVVKYMPIDGIVEVRGELYINKKFGKTVFKDKPLRNQIAGIIKSGDKSEFVDFVAYQMFFKDIEKMFKKESEVLDYLKQLQFDTMPYRIINSPEELEKEVKKYISKNRELYEYETDGLVVTVNDKMKQKEIDSKRNVRSFHYYNIAIKPPSKTAQSKLLDVEVNISKSGRLIPVMIYEPVFIDNVEFERATLNNYNFLKTFGNLYVGNTVHIMRGNDVIPVMLKVEENGNKNLPITVPEHECPSCGIQLIQEDKHTICPNLNCPGRNISTIYNWVLKRKMKNIGIKFLELAYEKGFIRSIIDLYDPDLESKIETLERFVPGGASVNRIITAIEKSKENVTDIDILSSIGIHGIGRNVLENINITNIDTLPSDIMGKNNFEIINDESVISKNSKNASNLVVYEYISNWLTIPGNYGELIKLKKILKSKSYNIDKNSKTVVITGTFEVKREELKKILEKKGYKVTDHVNRDTEILIVGEDAENHNKLKKARDLGSVKIVDIKEIL